jgi:hypothetical protein
MIRGYRLRMSENKKTKIQVFYPNLLNPPEEKYLEFFRIHNIFLEQFYILKVY